MMASEEFRDLNEMLARHPSARTEQCPDDADWIGLVLGGLPAAREEPLLDHATVCAHCALRLRQAIQCRDDADDAEDPQAIDERRVADQVLAIRAKQLRPNAVPKRRFIRYAAWAAALLVCASTIGWQLRRSAPDQQLIAEAYAKGRPFTYRVAGVPWGPAAENRGSAEGRVLPVPTGESPAELAWAARAALWERDYRRAIALLEKLKALNEDASDVHNNLAVAYAAQGDTAAALKIVKAAAERHPRDPALLFNLALLMTMEGQRQSAIEVWERFENLESDGNWRNESKRLRP
ncbi:MAG: tetratricopeptide repeat protein [Bryobacterales bacterium]|nr:tetratricopeptide repeat protein [Bryobacterales bacterium]